MTTTTYIPAEQESLCIHFSEKAQAVSAIVHTLKDFDAAVAYTADLCRRQLAPESAGSDSKKDIPADGKSTRILAAPDLEAQKFASLETPCTETGYTCIRSGLRSHLDGIDIGFTIADLAIAETGTLVISCPGEDLRLATMICDLHICVVRKQTIVKDAFAAEQLLLKYMHKTPNYTAFITGASRTADIERVLALGVHGPLELHILLVED